MPTSAGVAEVDLTYPLFHLTFDAYLYIRRELS